MKQEVLEHKITHHTHLRRRLADLRPIEFAMDGLVDNLAIRVEAEDVVAHRARSPRLQLVLVPEEALTSEATTIVQLPVGQHTQHGRFARVYVAHYRHPGKTREERGNQYWGTHETSPCFSLADAGSTRPG